MSTEGIENLSLLAAATVSHQFDGRDDMVLLCAEEDESVIWIDPRGRQFTRTELVPLVFNKVAEWKRVLGEANAPMCLQVMRTKTELVTLDRARHLVVQRMRRLAARKRAASRKGTGQRLQGM